MKRALLLETGFKSEARIEVKTTAVVRVIAIKEGEVILQPQGEHPVTLKVDDELVIRQIGSIIK